MHKGKERLYIAGTSVNGNTMVTGIYELRAERLFSSVHVSLLASLDSDSDKLLGLDQDSHG